MVEKASLTPVTLRTIQVLVVAAETGDMLIDQIEADGIQFVAISDRDEIMLALDGLELDLVMLDCRLGRQDGLVPSCCVTSSCVQTYP
jgi:DNA-binding response OmpR family regulator